MAEPRKPSSPASSSAPSGGSSTGSGGGSKEGSSSAPARTIRSSRAKTTPRSTKEREAYRAAVASYVAAGGDESVQRVVTAVHRLSRRLNQWYEKQLSDLDVSAGEWAVMLELAHLGEVEAQTPSQLAEATSIAPSSMTHRLDRMLERGLIEREQDPDNRTRVLIRLSHQGWELFATAIQEANLVESDVVGALTERQLQTLSGLLERLIAGVDNAED